jgi:pimeloyl-ACP methyl ester carboxylesterase
VETHSISYKSSIIHYYRFGHGPQWLFCFHGYGEEGSSFSIFEPLLGKAYTLIAIDFPFHGKTQWQEGLLFTTNDLLAIIDSIKPAGQAFSLLGYSMGGRVALQLLQEIPQQINRAVLVAPDGLHRNKWQWLSTRTLAGNRLFAYTMRNPRWMIRLMDLGGRLGLYNKSLLKFVHYYLDDAEQRIILYKRWTTMRGFRPDVELLKKNIVDHGIPVRLLFGRYDRVILARHGHHFSKGTNGFVQVTEIEAGHQLLREKHAMLIAGFLV